MLSKQEIIYAGPDGGFAQVALAYAAALHGKKAAVFLNVYTNSPGWQKPPLVKLAEALGVSEQKYTDKCIG